jgi:hypothetical protein
MSFCPVNLDIGLRLTLWISKSSKILDLVDVVLTSGQVEQVKPLAVRRYRLEVGVN